MKTKLYFVDHHGNVKVYSRIEREDYGNTAPCKGCDLLIEDEHGHRYSGDSKSYLESKKEALEQARTRQLEGIAVYEHTLTGYKEALSKIETELVLLNAATKKNLPESQHISNGIDTD